MILQQGDVLLIPVEVTSKPKGERSVLAEGEATGHAHRLNIPALVLAEAIIRVSEESQLTHEEHATITVPAGTYEVRIVREYDHFSEEAREVVD